MCDVNITEKPGDGTRQADVHSHVVFKGEFLDQLIDAVALIELAELIIKSHEEVGLNKSNMLGMAILMEQIKERLEIESNLISTDSDQPPRYLRRRRSESPTF